MPIPDVMKKHVKGIGLGTEEKIRIGSDNACIIVMSKGRVWCRIMVEYRSLAHPLVDFRY